MGEPKSKPKCFESQEQYDDWIELEGYTNLKKSPSEYCHDCLPEFKQQMLAQGRCEHPETRFRRDSEGQLFGDRRDTAKAVLASWATRKKRKEQTG